MHAVPCVSLPTEQSVLPTVESRLVELGASHLSGRWSFDTAGVLPATVRVHSGGVKSRTGNSVFRVAQLMSVSHFFREFIVTLLQFITSDLLLFDGAFQLRETSGMADLRHTSESYLTDSLFQLFIFLQGLFDLLYRFIQLILFVE